MTGFESFVGVSPWTALFTFWIMLITFVARRRTSLPKEDDRRPPAGD